MTLSPQHGLNARFYWHSANWSPYVEGVDLSLTRNVADLSLLGHDSMVRVPGVRDQKITLSGTAWERLTSDANAWARFTDSGGKPFAYLPGGDAVGRVAYCGIAMPDNPSISAGDDVVRIPCGIVSMAEIDRGKVLHALVSTGVSPGSSVDGVNETLTGGAAYLLCTASGGGSLVVTVEDSANNTDWAPLVVMTALSAVGSEVKAVAGMVRRYLRVSWTLSSGSATWFLAFARR